MWSPSSGSFSSGVCLHSLHAEGDLAISFFFFNTFFFFSFFFFLKSSSSSCTKRLECCVFFCFGVCPHGHCMAMDHHDNHPRLMVDIDPVQSAGRSETCWGPSPDLLSLGTCWLFVKPPLLFLKLKKFAVIVTSKFVLRV